LGAADTAWPAPTVIDPVPEATTACPSNVVMRAVPLSVDFDAVTPRRGQIGTHAGQRDGRVFAVIRRGQANVRRAVLEVEHGAGVVQLRKAAAAAGSQPERVRPDAQFDATIGAGVQAGGDRNDIVDLCDVPFAALVLLDAPDLRVTFGQSNSTSDQRRLAVGIGCLGRGR
jgi:hypothetical protein